MKLFGITLFSVFVITACFVDSTYDFGQVLSEPSEFCSQTGFSMSQACFDDAPLRLEQNKNFENGLKQWTH